jgi:hypothetical protein
MSDNNSASASRFASAPMILTELRRRRAEPNWLWRGYLAAGQVTLLTSQWKMGKTTLMAILLAKLNSGGELAGQAVTPARAAIVPRKPLTCRRYAPIILISGNITCSAARLDMFRRRTNGRRWSIISPGSTNRTACNS